MSGFALITSEPSTASLSNEVSLKYSAYLL